MTLQPNWPGLFSSCMGTETYLSCSWISFSLYIHTYMHAYIHPYIPTYLHASIHTYMYIIYIYIYTVYNWKVIEKGRTLKGMTSRDRNRRLHTLAVLLISLPPHRAPPERRVLQRLFTSDTWRLARHVAELLATVLLLGCRCFYGHLESVVNLWLIYG